MAPVENHEWRALVENAPMLIWRADLDACCDYCNLAWLEFTGREQAAELGHGWLEGVHPTERAAVLSRYLEHARRGVAFEHEFRLRHRDGEYRTVLLRATPSRDPRGDVVGFIAACVDVDDRTRELHASADEFFQTSLDSLCVTGFDGYFKRVNPSWSRTLGWTREELLATPVVDLMHPEDRERTLAARRRLHEGADMGPLVNRYRCKDGSYRWFEWRSVGHPERGLVYAAARDITEQREAAERLREAKEREEQLRRQLLLADRMASVGTLAAGVAHEINNPLAYVMANLSLMLEALHESSSTPSREQRATFEDMTREALDGAERIRKIVRGLKTFSRGEIEQRSVVDVREVMEQAIKMVSNEIRHRARLVKDFEATPFVEADDARLGQVFINLLINAAQAIPEGAAEDNEIRVVTTTDDAGRVVIEVRDTGPGIPASIVDRIFDPFFTTKPVGIGTGLGLSICHTIVTSMDGEITVVTPQPRGAVFRIVLPALSRPRPARVAATPTVAPTPPGTTVLIVDDEPAVGNVLGRMLHECAVTVVTTAREALALFDSGRRFDVIFSDLMMPEMSGMDLYDSLTRRFPDVARRVVFMSGGAFTPAADAFLLRVTAPRLDKPFDPPTVREIVRRIVAIEGALDASSSP